MRRIWLIVVAAVCAGGLLYVNPADAQTRPGGRSRSRPGAKPGEIITPPDIGERWRDRIAVGSPAPEFTLPLLPKPGKPDTGTETRATASGDSETVSLKELRSQRPAVLIFGSITCPPFRGQLEAVDKVYEDFRDRAEFLFVYIREAHPESVLSVVDADGQESLLKIPQAADAAERKSTAATCQRSVKLQMPVAVDTDDNAVGKAYAGWPNRMVVVGTDGRVLFASDPAPRGTDAQRLRDWLDEHLPARE
jgi:hypothetical protein